MARPMPPTASPPPSSHAERLRNFGPAGLGVILAAFAANALLSPLGAVVVVLWARAARLPWSAIGLARPRSWWRAAAAGVALGVFLKLLMKSVVLPLLGVDPMNPATQHLAGNLEAVLAILFAVTVGAGFGEETLFRGLLFERLGRLLGTGAAARAAIVLGTSLFFGAVHYPEQGWPGVQQATLVGLVLGSIYAMTGSLWLPMIAHAAFDVTAVAIIYRGWEREVAGWFFR